MHLPTLIDVPIEHINSLKCDFYTHNTDTLNGMEKITAIKNLQSVQDLVEHLSFNVDDLVGDTFYKHTYSYFPHVDAPAIDSNKYLQLVVPLEKEYDDEQYFIIFDQCSAIGFATWTGLLDADIDFVQNTQVKGYIRKQDITNFVEDGISDEFANKYLPYPKEWYKGLSANAYEWKPGKGIMFPSNRIHGSGKIPIGMYKLGVSLKFKLHENVY